MPADRWLAAVALAIALAPGAHVAAAPHSAGGDPDDPGVEPTAQPRAAARTAASGEATAPQDFLTRQLDEQAASIDRALAMVDDKLTAADQARIHRLGAAVRAVHAGAGDDALAVARRRAAARLLLDRDRGERGLLADEIGRLRTARTRIADEVIQLPQLALPTELARPARGKIARHFGTLEHERSKATLSRRGIDIEVEDHSPVTAPAAGTVRYAGPIRGLDHGVILDHGDYLTVVAKLGDVALPVGAPIGAGDRIGRAARHRVYLEVRVKLGPGGLPIDPEPLLGHTGEPDPATGPRPARPARTR